MSYGLYIARVVGAPKENDSRLQVRVIPQMNDIAQSYCPRWPFFFKKDCLLSATGDLVWVICNDDFSTGYILGIANYNTYTEDDDFSKYSISEDLKDKIQVSFGSVSIDGFSFKNMIVTYWNDNVIHMTEKTSGGVIYAFSNGTLYVFRSNEFLVKIGDGSMIKMDSKGFSVSAPSNISLDSKSVGLGKNADRFVMVTGGSGDKIAAVSDFVRA